MLQQRGATVRIEHQLRALRFGAERSKRSISAARPSRSAPTTPSSSRFRPMWRRRWCRGLDAPTEFRAIVNAHFRIEPPAEQPPILGVLNGTVQWIFAFPGRLSVTISAGDRLIDGPREELAKTIWDEVARITGLTAALPGGLPPWQIVRERRATFLRHARARRQTSRTGHRVAQSRAGRRLDRYRPARYH